MVDYRFLLAVLGGCLLFLGVAFIHPIGPALLLLAVTPFDGILFDLFDWYSNALTLVLVTIFFVRTPVPLWGAALLGTRVQRVMGLFMVCLVASHIVSVPYTGPLIVVDYMRKANLFVLASMVTWSLRESRYVPVVAQVLSISTAIFCALTILDFYLGVKILPVSHSAWGAEGARGQEVTAAAMSDLRLDAPGLGTNRFANVLLLPLFLAFGWMMSKAHRRQRWAALACLVLMLVAMLGTVSRSGIGALGVGLLVLLPAAFRVRPANVLVTALAGSVIAALAWFLFGQLGLEEAVTARFGGSMLQDSTSMRMQLVVGSLRLFVANPVFGIGEVGFAQHVAPFVHGAALGKGPHNSYLSMLAARGLVGSVPFAMLLWLVFQQLRRRGRVFVSELEYWQPYFFAALITLLFQNFFNEYPWERLLWVLFGVAAAFERFEAEAARKRRAAGPVTPSGLETLPASEPM